ncbi:MULTISPECIES: carbohydrate ABC transporter permease [unclassified Oceanispirochaeta]|uniref:carbohydrate ABC transporter permease n=1 Tax=unclassified Oceanispirochaeta TaxID=2635722 RepID=UPI000E09CD2F|nr:MULTISPECIES: carbohydrate ABC transporter permease [unclassified Oceanispirochaeta]MBF9015523.1 carbohydrate ABC transporter permease [Oceanispirochaeta sp. M2]NPD71982.1 carbohydrate ABC transporter permease [Oceanispirochaeta sp. M1]RDG32788.1 carbohydrate ABC transporter permease [Oceanispirochaeta sp. M1]
MVGTSVSNKITLDKLIQVVFSVILLASTIVVLWPLLYILSASFSSPEAVISGKVWLFPVEPTLAGYAAVFRNRHILSGFSNSFFYMFIGTAVNIIFTLLAAYPLSRKEFTARRYFSALFVFTMLFSGGLIPLYLVVKSVGLLDTRAALILPTALSVWNLIITRTYMQMSIPDEMYEAAMLDGSNDIQFFLKIVIPLSGPIIAVIALYYGVSHWNRYFEALIFLKTRSLFPLQLVLRSILVTNNIDPMMITDAEELIRKQGLVDLLKYSTIVVASVPVLCIYPFVQKYFIKGIMIGSLKG